MKVKTNLRAGAGGASGAGHNSVTDPSVVDVSGKTVVVYVPPVIVSRCAGY
jgi:hypothetical protein